MTCSFCGAANPANFVVCQRCGERRVIDLSQSRDPQPAPTVLAAVRPPPASPGSGPPPGYPPGYPTTPSTRLPGALHDLHAGYRTARMHHGPPDELASSEVTLKTLRPHLLRFVVFYLVEFILGLISVPILLINAIGAAGAGGYGGQQSLGALGSLLLVLMAVVAIAWAVSLFLPIREPIAEYGVLLEGCAPASADAFGWIAQVVQQRRTPVQVGDASTGGRSLLTFTSGLERAAVLVVGYGVDLYVGWTMWRSRSTMQVLVHYFRDLCQNLGGGTYASDVRVGDTRAFRELVHSATREGAEVAVIHAASTP